MTAKVALKDPVIEGLRALLGGRFSTSRPVCEQHGILLHAPCANSLSLSKHEVC